jgi:uncharacterized membrane protein YwzB
MIDLLIHLIVVLLIIGVVYWAVKAVLGLIPVPAPIRQIIDVLLVLVLALILIYALLPLLGAGFHIGRL